MLEINSPVPSNKLMSFVTKLKRVPKLVDDWLATKHDNMPEYYNGIHHYNFPSSQSKATFYTSRVAPEYTPKKRNSISNELSLNRSSNGVTFRQVKGETLNRPKTTFEVREEAPQIPLVEELPPITLQHLLDTPPPLPPKLSRSNSIKRVSMEPKHASLRKEVKIIFNNSNQKIVKPRFRTSKLDFQPPTPQMQSIRVNMANAKLGSSAQRIKIAHQIRKERQQAVDVSDSASSTTSSQKAPTYQKPIKSVTVNNKRISKITAFDRAIANKRGSTLKLSLTPKVAS